jgi:hypothetical protein
MQHAAARPACQHEPCQGYWISGRTGGAGPLTMARVRHQLGCLHAPGAAGATHLLKRAATHQRKTLPHTRAAHCHMVAREAGGTDSSGNCELLLASSS